MINKKIKPPKIKGFDFNISNGKIIKKPLKPKININKSSKTKNKIKEEDLFNFNFINKI